MTIYTYHFSRSLAESLGISFTETPELSDQMIDIHQPDDRFANYATRGGGAAGSKNGHYGCKHSEETKQILREKRLGKEPSNKGVPNPEQSERWKKNNPMKNPEIAAKVASKLKGRPSPFRGIKYKPSKPVRFGKDGRKKTIWFFPDGRSILVEDTRKMCDQLGLSYSAVRHKIGKGPYEQGKHKGLRIDRYISQDPETQASS